MKKLLLILLAIVPYIHAMEMIAPSGVSAAQQLKLYANENDLFVEDDNAAYRVEKYNMNPLLREVVARKAMGKFTDNGYIRVKQLSDGKYALEAKVRGDGGFLLTGVIVYQGCRVIGYTGLVLGSISTVAAATATGGPAGFFMASSAVIQASGPAAAAIETGSLAIGTAASWIPILP